MVDDEQDKQDSNFKRILNLLKKGNANFAAIMNEIKPLDEIKKYAIIEKMLDKDYKDFATIMEELHTWKSIPCKYFMILKILNKGYTDFFAIMEEIKSWDNSEQNRYYKYIILETMVNNGYEDFETIMAIIEEIKAWEETLIKYTIQPIILKQKRKKRK